MAEESSAGPSARLGKLTYANMFRSLLPLVAIVLALAYFCSPHNLDPVAEIDPTTSISYAAGIADVPLPVPVLNETWRPTSVDVIEPQDPESGLVTLTIGYVTPTEEFARYLVSTDPDAALIEDLLADADSAGAVTLGGQAWEELTTSRGEQLLLRTDGDLRVVVTGSANEDELRALVESLAPYSG